MEVSFKLEKETKNTYRFQEVDEKGEVVDWDKQLMGTIYVKKVAFEKKPDTFKITLEI